MSQVSENKLHSLAIQVRTLLMVQILRPQGENGQRDQVPAF